MYHRWHEKQVKKKSASGVGRPPTTKNREAPKLLFMIREVRTAIPTALTQAEGAGQAVALVQFKPGCLPPVSSLRV